MKKLPPLYFVRTKQGAVVVDSRHYRVPRFKRARAAGKSAMRRAVNAARDLARSFKTVVLVRGRARAGAVSIIKIFSGG